MPPTIRRITRQYHPLLFVPSGIFPILSLPLELTTQIASYLTPREIFALLLVSPSFEHLLYVFTVNYTREQVIHEDRRNRHYTPLQFFCSRGVERVVRRMLEAGVNPNQVIPSDPSQISPLIHAIGFRGANIVALLIQYGAHVNDIDGSLRKTMHSATRGNTPLQFVVGTPNSIPPRRTRDREGYNARGTELPRILQLLLDAGANVNARNELRHTALHIACATQHANPLFVRSLIAAGADINLTTDLIPYWCERGIKPIHYAANAGHLEIVRILLDAGSSVNTRTRHWMMPLDLAILHMRRDLVELLVGVGAYVGDGSGSLDPFAMVHETATWEDLKSWLHARGVRGTGKSLSEWWNQGKAYGRTPVRSGENNKWKKWTGI